MIRITNWPVRFGLLWLLGCGAASMASAAEPARIDSLTFRSGFVEFRAEGVEFEGLNLSPDALEILLHGKDNSAQAKALATLDATTIRIARLRETQTVGGQSSTTIFSNVGLTDIKAGIVRKLHADQINFATLGALDDTSTGLAGPLTVEDVDLALLLGLGSQVGDGKPHDFKLAYHLAQIETLAIQSTKGPTVAIDRIEIRDERLRETNDGFAAITERFVKHQSDPNPPGDAELGAMARDVLDLFSAVSTGSIEITGLALRETAQPTNFAAIKRFAYHGGLEGPSSYQIEGIEVAIDDFRMKIGSLAQSDIKLGTVLDGLKKALAKPNVKPADIDPALFVPMIGRIELNTMAMDADLDGMKHSGVRSFLFAVETGADASPTSVELSFDGLTGPLPATSTEPAIQSLMGLGYRYINASGTIKLAIDAKAQDLTLNSTLSAENMAALNLSGTIGNVSASALAAHPDTAPLMLLSASLKSLSFAVENHGIAERLIDQQAIRTKRSPAEIRASYASAAAASLQIYLGMSPTAKNLTQSIVNFIGKPDHLQIAAQAKNPAGVTISDTATGSGPASILDLFELQIDQK